MQYKPIKRLVFNSFILFFMIFMSKKMNLIVSTYFTGNLAWVFSDKTLLSVVFILLIVLLLINAAIELRLQFHPFFCFLFLFLLADLIFVSIIYKSYLFSLAETALLQVASNFGLLTVLFLLAFMFQSKEMKIDDWYRMPLVFITLQSFLGVAQFLTKSALFTNSSQIIGNSYYINGVSNSNIDVINYGGYFRASGFTNSSLTLGLFMLFGIVLTHYLNNIKIRMFLTILFSLTVFMTFTRIIWIAWLFLCLFLYVPRLKSAHRTQIIISGIFWTLQVALPSMQQLAATFGSSSFFSTMLSRFNGYSTFINLFPFDTSNFFTGQNFITRIAEYSYLPYSLDNQYLVLMFNLGLIGYFVYLVANLFVVKKLLELDQKSQNIGKLLLVMPLIGITNDPSYFVNGILVISVLYIINFSKKKEQHEGNVYSNN